MNLLILLLEIFIDDQDALREKTLMYTLCERKLIYFAFFPPALMSYW